MKIKKTPAQGVQGEGLRETFRQYAMLTSKIKAYQDRADVLKDRMKEMLLTYGQRDDKGHYNFELDPPIAGVRRLQRQCRVTQTLDEAMTEELLQELGLWNECVEMVPTISEDAILANAYGDDAPITEEMMKQIYEEKEVIAFVPVK